MGNVRGVGFDLDHTLEIDNRLERVALLHLLEALLEHGGHAIGTLAEEIENIDDLLASQRRGDFPIDEAVRRFVASRGLVPAASQVQYFRRTAEQMVEEFVVALPGVQATLDFLQERGIATAVLSNGWNPLQARKADRAGFRGRVLVSSEIGAQKPQRRAFEMLSEALGTPPNETWYVGDNPYGDVAGAQAAGMCGVWLNWERNEYPPELPAPAHEIRDLREVIELLTPARLA